MRTTAILKQAHSALILALLGGELTEYPNQREEYSRLKDHLWRVIKKDIRTKMKISCKKCPYKTTKEKGACVSDPKECSKWQTELCDDGEEHRFYDGMCIRCGQEQPKEEK